LQLGKKKFGGGYTGVVATNNLGEDVTCDTRALVNLEVTNRISELQVWYNVFTGVNKITVINTDSETSATEGNAGDGDI